MNTHIVEKLVDLTQDEQKNFKLIKKFDNIFHNYCLGIKETQEGRFYSDDYKGVTFEKKEDLILALKLKTIKEITKQ